MQDESFDPTDESLNGIAKMNGNNYYFMSPKQVYDRAKYVVDNNLQGIFYWDMGNDIDTTNPLSISRNASYALNSNVDKLVESVTISHPTGISLLNTGGKKAMQYDSLKQTISIEGGKTAKLTVYTLAGTLVKQATASSLSLADMASGCYVVKADLGNGKAPLKVKVMKP